MSVSRLTLVASLPSRWVTLALALALVSCSRSKPIPATTLGESTTIPADPVEALMRETERVRVGELLERLRGAKGPDGTPIELLGTGEYGERVVAYLSGKRHEFPSWYCALKVGGAQYKLVFLVDRNAISYDGAPAFRTKIETARGLQVPLQEFFGGLFAANTVAVTDLAPFKAMKLQGYDDYSIHDAYEQLKAVADPGTLRVVSILGQYKMVAKSKGQDIYIGVENSAEYGYSFHACGPRKRMCAPPTYPLSEVLD